MYNSVFCTVLFLTTFFPPPRSEVFSVPLVCSVVFNLAGFLQHLIKIKPKPSVAFNTHENATQRVQAIINSLQDTETADQHVLYFLSGHSIV